VQVHNLHITLEQRTLVHIDFTINSSLALVGQSGSGKSLTVKALLDMLPTSMQRDLHVEADFELIAGKTVSFVPQNPFTALSPLTKIKNQMFLDDANTAELFQLIGLDLALLNRFPSELSGGQLQRVIIAMALGTYPKLLLLDEPTTALDPATRVNIIRLLKELQKKIGFLMLFVTHDINSAKLLCEDICVIQTGRVVEAGKLREVLQSPAQTYTQTLIAADFGNRKFRE
jgi:ABC-type glutathione transport system ATPase component